MTKDPQAFLYNLLSETQAKHFAIASKLHSRVLSPDGYLEVKELLGRVKVPLPRVPDLALGITRWLMNPRRKGEPIPREEIERLPREDQVIYQDILAFLALVMLLSTRASFITSKELPPRLAIAAHHPRYSKSIVALDTHYGNHLAFVEFFDVLDKLRTLALTKDKVTPKQVQAVLKRLMVAVSTTAATYTGMAFEDTTQTTRLMWGL